MNQAYSRKLREPAERAGDGGPLPLDNQRDPRELPAYSARDAARLLRVPSSRLPVRWIGNDRLPVAVALDAIRPQDQPPVPGVHLTAEKDGMYVETWAPIECSDAPDGPKCAPTVHWWAPRAHRRSAVDRRASKARLSAGGAIG